MAGPSEAWVAKIYHWPTATVTYWVNPLNDDGMLEADVISAMQQAASAWSTQAHPAVALSYAGTTTVRAVGRDRVNNVFFRPESSGATMAVTYWWYDSSGHLVDFDILFFDAGFRFFATPTGCSGGDYVLDVATHEFGHGLGLSHSAVGAATMWPSTGVCSTAWRSLDADDVAGIQAQYPGPRPRQPWTLGVGR